MLIHALPDFAGDNAAHSIASLITAAGMPMPDPPFVSMLLIRELSGGVGKSRIGGSYVSLTRGAPLNSSSNESLTIPNIIGYPGSARGWDLNGIYVFAATGDTLSVSYADEE